MKLLLKLISKFGCPALAGGECPPTKVGHPIFLNWIPAFAGMTFLLSSFAFADGMGTPSSPKPSTGPKVVTQSVGAVLGPGGTNEGGSEGIQMDEFTGAGTYKIPIEVPPGRGGIDPNLILNYNSYRKNPNSWVGLGWELEIGSIIRIQENGVTNFNDGKAYEFRFAGQAETLVWENTLPLSTYGLEDYAPSDAIADVYFAKIQSAYNLFLHIREKNYAGMPKDYGWVVIDKGGRRYFLGSHDDSRDQKDAGDDKKIIARWLLDKVLTPNDNALIVEYGTDLLPSEISYDDIVIKFGKSKNVRYYPSFKQGFLQNEQISSLTDITVSQIIGSGQTRLQRIVFEYDEDGANSAPLLKNIQKFGKTNDVSLPATTAKYYGMAAYSWGEADGWIATVKNGDETGGGYLNHNSTMADMNGDGLIDHVVAFPKSKEIWVRLNNLNGFYGNFKEWWEPFLCAQEDYVIDPDKNSGQTYCDGKISAQREDHQWLYLMDMNGDGLPDRVGRTFKDDNYTSKDGYFAISFNKGNGWQQDPVVWKDPYVGDYSATIDKEKGLIDMNGDGLVDRVIGSKAVEGFKVYYNTGAGFKMSYTIWKDPLALVNPDNISAHKIRNESNGKVYADIRDVNGDGLPDRIFGIAIHMNDGSVKPGFDYAMNLNGAKWKEPFIDSCNDGTPKCIIPNATDFLSMVDPSSPDGEDGFISDETHDLIDMNNDGYLDRVAGDTDNDKINVYFYQGLGTGSVIKHFKDEPKELTDPIGGDDAGYLTKQDGANLRAFILDINGDRYPDRISVSKADSSDNVYFNVHKLSAHAFTFSDLPSWWNNKVVNQPLGALMSVNNGRGTKMAIEYIPSSWPYLSQKSNNRFLPSPMYVTYKLYTADHTVPWKSEFAEGIRNPHMRWVTYNYFGGHLFIRYAMNEDIPYYSRFNGFQRVEKIYEPLSGENWVGYKVITKYHQAEGDVPVGKITDDQLFDPAGFAHYSLSGKMYSRVVREDGDFLRSEQTNTWSVNSAEGMSCATVDCQVKLVSAKTETYEDSTPRATEKKYKYDSDGNVTEEAIYANSELYLKNANSYYSFTEFADKLKIRDRPNVQTQQLNGTVYRKKKYEYDVKGNPTKEIFFADAGGEKIETIERKFDFFGNIIELKGRDGVVKKLTYDDNHLFPVKEEVSLPNGGKLITTRIFDRLTGRVSSEYNPQNVGRIVEFDDFGRPGDEYIAKTDGTLTLIKKHKYTYENHGVEEASDIFLKTETWKIQPEYLSTLLNPAEITYTDGRGMTLQKCAHSERGDYRLVQARVLENGRREVVSEPAFADDCAFLDEIPSGAPVTASLKDIFRRPLKITPPEGEAGSPTELTEVKYITDALTKELEKKITMPKGQVRWEFYDGIGRLIKVSTEENALLKFTYNPVGDPLTTTINDKPMTSIKYDLLGRKLLTNDADMGSWYYSYDEFGRLYAQMDNKKQQTIMTYDNLGRMTMKQYFKEDKILEKTEKFIYDAASDGYDVLPGELFEVVETSANGELLRTSRFSYDPLYRRMAKMSRNIAGLGELRQVFVYDSIGKLKQTSYAGSSFLYYKYNTAGGLWQVCEAASCKSSDGEVYYTLDPKTAFNENGQLLKEIYGNEVATEYEYFAKSHRLQAKKTVFGDKVYSERNFTYDARANLLTATDPLNLVGGSGIVGAIYDSLNRLTVTAYADGATGTMSYDSTGNILKNTGVYGNQAYQYNSTRPHAVTSIGNENFEYDGNGNMATDAFRTMKYNVQNQLMQVVMKNGGTVDFDYDYTGARVLKKSIAKDTDGKTFETVTHYLGDAIEIKSSPSPLVGEDGGEGISEGEVTLNIFANNQMAASRSLGKLSDILAAQNGVGTLSPPEWLVYHHTDRLGSSHLITEGLKMGKHAGLMFPSGSVVQRFEYSAWGQERFALNPNLSFDPRFTGQEYDIETGLYYFKARYYNPALGRFIQPDTIVQAPTDPQSWNRYSYVRNNPLKYVDPSGHIGEELLGPDPVEGALLGDDDSPDPDQGDDPAEGTDDDGAGDSDSTPESGGLPGEITDSNNNSGLGAVETEDFKGPSLITDMSENNTTFDPGDYEPEQDPFTIETRNDVTNNATPGAQDPFSTDNARVVHETNNDDAYGPPGAYIDTGDARGRDIHGGGSSLSDPLADRQGWAPTLGCTRGQNEDVINLGQQIEAFQREHPGVPIPYERRW